MKSITCWYREVYNKKRDVMEYPFNHIEDGFSREDTPFAAFPEQKKNWEKAKWKRAHAYLTKDNVVVGELKDV